MKEQFLADDLPLFENIIQDLFPGTERPEDDFGELEPTLKEVCQWEQFNLQSTEWFMTKMLQLMDTIRVRHGMMIVGPTGAGKTCNYRVRKGWKLRGC